MPLDARGRAVARGGHRSGAGTAVVLAAHVMYAPRNVHVQTLGLGWYKLNDAVLSGSRIVRREVPPRSWGVVRLWRWWHAAVCVCVGGGGGRRSSGSWRPALLAGSSALCGAQ